MEKMALEIISGMKEWRVENPKATFVEIERETMTGLCLRATVPS